MISRWKTYILTICVSYLCSWTLGNSDKVKCGGLLMGQYFCPEPSIDPTTQAAVDCTENHTVELKCKTAPEFTEKDGHDNITECVKNVSCRYTNGHSYETALLLSVFLGMFGIDRFYLGYPAIGLLKFCTLGFFFIFHLIDVILIATQVVGPADGSEYIIDYYGPRLMHITRNNDTFYKLQE